MAKREKAKSNNSELSFGGAANSTRADNLGNVIGIGRETE